MQQKNFNAAQNNSSKLYGFPFNNNRKNLKGLCDKWKNFLELNQGFVAMKTSVRAGGRGDQEADRAETS